MRGRLPLGPLVASARQPILIDCEVEDMVVRKARLSAVAGAPNLAPGFEEATPLDGAALASQLCARAAVHHAAAFCGAVEDALAIEVPEPHGAMRVVLSEWARIASHLEVISDIGRCLEDDLVYGRARQRIARLRDALTEACGNPFGFGVIVPGGVRMGEGGGADSLDRLSKDAGTLERDVSFLSRKLSFSRGRLGRGRLIAPTSDGEVPAAALRASGSTLDLRAGESASGFYAGMGYRPASREGGTALDRALLLLMEIKSSLGLIEAARTAAREYQGPPEPIPVRTGTGVGSWESPHGAIEYRVFLSADGRLIRARGSSAAARVTEVAGAAIEGAYFEDAAAVLVSLDLCTCCMSLGGHERVGATASD